MADINGTDGNDTLTDTAANDTINGFAGDDWIRIFNGRFDSVDGGTGTDRLRIAPSSTTSGITLNVASGLATWTDSQISFVNIERFEIAGTAFADTITTGSGDDEFSDSFQQRLASYGGNDFVVLGAGIDNLFLNLVGLALGAQMTITGETADGYSGRVSFSDGAFLDFTGVDTFHLNGSDFAADLLRGGRNVDLLAGYDGDDTIYGEGGDDRLYGGHGDDIIYGGDGNDTMDGDGNINQLYGEGGNDIIDGVNGSGLLDGGEGEDIFTVDNNDQVVGGAGFDRMIFNWSTSNSITFTATPNLAGGWDGTVTGGTTYSSIEQFDVTTRTGNDNVTTGSGDDVITLNAGTDVGDGGDGNDSISGGAGADQLFGRGGNDFLDGGTEADDLRGGAGNDVYVLDNAGDQVTELAGEGTDEVRTTAVSASLSQFANVENLTAGTNLGHRLTGNDGDNVITGGGGQDTLIGLLGTDTLIGGGGNDSYLVSDSRAIIVEAADGGNDTVYVTVDYRLTPGASVETITPYERGLTEPLRLTGNEFANTIYGNAGNNVLTGLGGADLLYGLGGDDAYLVEDSLDQIFESSGQGYDTVYTESDFFLNNASFVEAISVYDRDTTNALTLFGNNLDNVIYGNQGSNALLGGGGEDTLYGLGGDDRYFVDSLGDQVIEAANAGNDTIYTTLGSYQLITDQQVETLTVYDRDTTYAATLIGNNLAQFIYGNAGANNIDGKGGADTLYGMAGQDTFTFTNAPIAGAPDMLADFSAADDTIALDDVAFLGIGAPGALNANAFVIGSAAADADDRIVYNQATGQLFFDADGNGAGAQVLFATVNAGTVLSASDFVVI